MPNEYYILIKISEGIERVTEAISRFLGHPIMKRTDVEWELYWTQAVGFDIRVYEADVFENDAGIAYEEYQIMVVIAGLHVMTPVESFEAYFRLFSLTLADTLSQRLECECLVVLNYTCVVGSFPPAVADEQATS